MNRIYKLLAPVDHALLQEETTRIEKRIDELEAVRRTFSDECLIVSGGPDSFRYYAQKSVSPGERTRRYLGSKDEERIQQLSDKRYVEEALRQLNKRLKAVKCLDGLDFGKQEQEVYETLKQKGIHISSALFLPQEERIRIWKNQSYGKKTAYAEEKTVLTLGGEYVRSKSEALIANELYEMGIPYRYEAELRLNGSKYPIFPDFTILHPKELRVLYWEHLGMMDDPQYASEACRRIQLYTQNGIIHGETLILTMETRAVPLSAGQVRGMIRSFLGND